MVVDKTNDEDLMVLATKVVTQDTHQSEEQNNINGTNGSISRDKKKRH